MAANRNLPKDNNSIDLVTTSPKGLNTRSKVSFKEAFDLHFINGLPNSKISKLLGCSTATIYNMLKPVKDLLKKENIYAVYAKNEEKLLTMAESKLLHCMFDDEKLAKAPLNQLAFAYDKLRLARKGKFSGGVDVKIELVFQEAEKEARKISRMHTDIVIDRPKEIEHTVDT